MENFLDRTRREEREYTINNLSKKAYVIVTDVQWARDKSVTVELLEANENAIIINKKRHFLSIALDDVLAQQDDATIIDYIFQQLQAMSINTIRTKKTFRIL